VTPGEFLDELDAVIAKAKAHRKRKRDVVLPLYGKQFVLGQEGVYVSEDERGVVWGFTLKQCRAMREVILAAAREDAKAAGL
jgi:hypothetical protein